MKQNIIKETEISYFNNGQIDRENSITLTIDEFVLEKRKKPCPEALQELKRQKKQILESKKENCPIEPYRTFELSVGTLLQEKKRGYRGYRREQQINQVINLLSQMQKERKISDISRDYILTILKQFSNLKPRTRQRVINQILEKATSKQDRVYSKKILVNEHHFEKKFKGERTKTKKPMIDKVYESRAVVDTYYSFV